MGRPPRVIVTPIQPKVVHYWPVPTVDRFHQSEAFYRLLMGPRNSGKSYGCCYEIVKRAMEQEPAPDGMRHTSWVVIRQCYDDKTELLTENGWCLFKDLNPGVKVAQLLKGELKFVLPLYYHKTPYVGEMIAFENEGIDFCVTPDHWMYVKREGRNFGLRRAGEIYGKTGIRVKRDALWQGETKYSVDFFEWLGFWFAEGNAFIRKSKEGHLRHACTIIQKNDLDYVRGLFTRANLPFTERQRKDGVFVFSLLVNPQTKQLIKELSSCGGATTKAVPQWIKEFSSEHLSAFIFGFEKGDGYIRIEGTRIVNTSSKQLADDLQEIALRAGLVANINKVAEAGVAYAIGGKTGVTTSAQYTVTFLKASKYNTYLQRGGYAKKYKGWHKIPYAGDVYCVEVPSHLIYVRRNGKAFWCSNTYPELFSSTIESWMVVAKDLGTLNHQSKVFSMRFGEVDAKVQFMALDIPDDRKHLLSVQRTGVWFNECREMPKPIIDTATEVAGRYPPMEWGGPTWRGIFMDTNPPDSDHWIYKHAEMMKPQGLLPNWDFFKQPGALMEVDGQFVPNPQAENINNIDGGYNYYLRLMEGKSVEHIRVYYCGQYGFVQEGKPVHPEYVDSQHTAKKILHADPYLPLVIGIDWGLTPACTVWQRQRNRQWWCLDEIATEDTSIETFADMLLGPLLRGKYKGFVVECYGDPGAHRQETDERTAFDILKQHGISVRPAPSNNPAARREALAHTFLRSVDGGPGVQISPNCIQLRKGLAGKYYYRRVQVRNEEMYHDKPVKNFWSHVCESAEYGLLGAGEGREEIGKKRHQSLKRVYRGPYAWLGR